MLRQLLNDESGVIISAELILVLTIAVLAMIVGLSEIAVAINTEMNDLSNAFGALDQSFATVKYVGADTKVKWILGSATFKDAVDDCDLNTSCDIVGGASATATVEGGSF